MEKNSKQGETREKRGRKRGEGADWMEANLAKFLRVRVKTQLIPKLSNKVGKGMAENLCPTKRSSYISIQKYQVWSIRFRALGEEYAIHNDH